MPNLNEEKKLWRKGYKRVACLDEAGRGALCGPVVAATVIINKKLLLQNLLDSDSNRNSNRIKDSKQLSQRKREEFYQILIKNPRIKWAIGRVSEKVIDRINILEATKLAMKRAFKNLNCKLKIVNCKIDFLIIDGNFKLDLPISQKSVIKADEKVFSCSAASIIAKITRDRIMMRYHKKYPKYRFDLHKGYGTKLHRRMLKKYGRCVIHRRSFKYGCS